MVLPTTVSGQSPCYRTQLLGFDSNGEKNSDNRHSHIAPPLVRRQRSLTAHLPSRENGGRGRPALTVMGTTVAGVVVTADRVLAFNVGDSKADAAGPAVCAS